MMCLMAVLLTSPIVVNFSFAQDPPEMFISPATTITNPTEYFTVEVYLVDAVGVAAWEFKVTWDLALTEFPPETVEGGFFQDAGYGTYFQVSNSILYKNVLAGCFMTEPGSVDGEGTLAYITFQVKATESGASTIHLYDTKLWDENGYLIPHTTTDGTFGTTKPKPIFTWTPAHPLPGELVTFDGSASYDPDGGNIVAWAWDFGDGSPIEYGMVVTHTYDDYRLEPYHVKLTVTDDDDLASWFVIKDLAIWRDLGIVSVWPSMDEWDTTAITGYQTYVDYYMDLPGLLWLLITVVNFGTQTEDFHVDCYMDADTSVIGDEFVFVNIYTFEPGLDWTVAPDAGTGFGLAFLLDVSYGAGVFGINDPVPPGDYTITAIMTSEFDQDPTNNMGQEPFGLHGSVEVTRIVRASAGKADHVYKMKHGPIIFGGFIANFDNTYDILRAPDDQGEYGMLVVEIMDEMGEIVAHLTSDIVYLDYLEECPDQLTVMWSDLAEGTYTGLAWAEFGTDEGYLPFWGENTIDFTFSIVP